MAVSQELMAIARLLTADAARPTVAGAALGRAIKDFLASGKNQDTLTPVRGCSLSIRKTGGGALVGTISIEYKPTFHISYKDGVREFTSRGKMGDRQIESLGHRLYWFVYETETRWKVSSALHDDLEKEPQEFKDQMQERAEAAGIETTYVDMTVDDVKRLRDIYQDLKREAKK
jgi:hypothetical protein